MTRTPKLGHADRTQVMGILNVTPDSFSDGGRYIEPEDAVARAREIDEAGADVIDVGGESTRPGAEPVSSEEEVARVVPVVERIASDLTIDAMISIDTYDPAVAAAALDAGVDVINDQNGLKDPEMCSLVATRDCQAVLMDSVNLPVDPEYRDNMDDIVTEVRHRLENRVETALDAGVAPAQIVVDPGIGFATSESDDMTLIARTDDISSLGFPVLVGASRKSFIQSVVDLPPSDRIAPSIAAHLVAAKTGADVVRVHDVGDTVAALRTAEILWKIGQKHE